MKPLGGSFRDPNGFVFERDGVLHRSVAPSYAGDYEHLMSSGLYAELIERGWLIPHDEVDPTGDPGAHLLLRPERVEFISYPYEWCFGALRDAALLTLRVQKAALRRGMTLKDATATNVQFHRGRPIWIDTLSFERRVAGAPWVAYRQFCQHFLAPLALMARSDIRLGQLLRIHLDGIPLDLACSLLPWRTWLNLQLVLHLRVHARYQRRYAAAGTPAPVRPLASGALENLIAGLESAVSSLDWVPEGTQWAGYTEGDSYSETALQHKRELVAGHLDDLSPRRLWDLGANTGEWSRLAANRDIDTVAFDLDPACVERNYRRVRRDGETRLLPLLLDLANPSPALGWSSVERSSFLERGPTDAILALALVHHLAIGNNVPLPRVAALFAGLAPHLVVEFVPKPDPKVRALLTHREDVFPDYTSEGFEAAFASEFEILAADPIRDSERTLYRMRRRAVSANA